MKALETAVETISTIKNETPGELNVPLMESYLNKIRDTPADALVITEIDFAKAKYLNDYFMKFMFIYCGFNFSETLAIEEIINRTYR